MCLARAIRTVLFASMSAPGAATATATPDLSVNQLNGVNISIFSSSNGVSASTAVPSRARAATPQGRNVVLPDFAQLHVMTQNVYDGIEYSHLLMPDLTVLSDITATNPASRAALHAHLIALEQPDLLAIQEAVLVERNNVPQVDMLQNLLDELDKLHKRYEVIVKVKGLDTGSGNAVRVSLWDAILVRSDIDRVVTQTKWGVYKKSLNLISSRAFAPDESQSFPNLNFRRNWMFVDIQLRGHTFRFVTTHLDLPDTGRQQSCELLQVAGNTRLPVIVAGDFNERYAQHKCLAAADYRDAWMADDGATWCQGENAWCANVATPPERIDLILLHGAVSAISVHSVGTEPAPCSECVHWASDHAGVAAGLIFDSNMRRRVSLPSQ